MLELDKVKMYCSNDFWLGPQCEFLCPRYYCQASQILHAAIVDGGFSCFLRDLGYIILSLRSSTKCLVSGVGCWLEQPQTACSPWCTYLENLHTVLGHRSASPCTCSFSFYLYSIIYIFLYYFFVHLFLFLSCFCLLQVSQL